MSEVHDFDGITEYDNDLPRWWLAILYGSIAFALVYAWWYHASGIGAVGPVALAREEAIVAELRAKDASGPLPEELLRQLSHNAERIAHGKALFAKSQCATCHGPEATGLVGPNLRDDAWIYGSDMATIVETITDGRANNAMPPQRANLSSQEIVDLACFIAAQNRDAKAPGKAPDPAREHQQPITY